MVKLFKLMCIGGFLGAGCSIIRSYQKDEPIDELVINATKSTAVGACIGGSIGVLFWRRKKRRKTLVMSYASKRAFRHATKKFKKAKPTFKEAFEIAAPIIETWAEQSKPVVKEVVESTKKLAEEAKESAKPMVKDIKLMTVDATEAMKPHAKRAVKRAVAQMHEAQKGRKKGRKRSQSLKGTLGSPGTVLVDIRDELTALGDHKKSQPLVVQID